MTPAQNRLSQTRTMIERRREVGRLRASGLRDQREIARRLEVGQATISRDFAALDQEYRAAALADIITEKGRDLDRVETLIAAIWGEALGGAVGVIDRVIDLMQLRAKILGLEAPTKIDLRLEMIALGRAAGLEEAEAIAEAETILREVHA
jgi:hypothetical protein